MKNNTNITNASIESAGLPKDYKNAIAEYIWNGFDAKATQVAIRFESNELGYLQQISFEDNGEGIDHSTLNRSFGNFLDSIKRNSLKRSSYTRGKKGKGRFSFSLFATRATWKTRYRDVSAAVRSYDIIIDRHQKETYEDSFQVEATDQQPGTTLLLEGIFGLDAAYLTSDAFHHFLAQEFGWFLFLNKEQNFEITLNGKPLSYQQLIAENEIVKWDIAGDDEHAYSFTVNYIRWKENIGDRYYYYFLNAHKTEIAKELTSFNNNAIDFHHSVYIQSAFFNGFDQETVEISRDENLFSSLHQHLVFKKLNSELRSLLDRKQKKFVREEVAENMLTDLLNKHILPTYTERPSDQQRKTTLLLLLKELCIAEPKVFASMKSDYIKAYLGFIDLLLQTEKRSRILEVIEQTLPLAEKERMHIAAILST